MANLNIESFSEEDRKIAPMECAAYLYECLTEEEKVSLKKDWDNVGGYMFIPWWKWCMDHINVSLGK